MSAPLHVFRRALFALSLFAAATAACAAAPAAEARQVWQLLDYIAVDYAEAVQGGKIVSAAEFAEMTEFSQTVQQRLALLPASATQSQRVAQAAQLRELVADHADPAAVAAHARRLAQALLVDYSIHAVPVALPEPQRVSALYAQHCAACHGARGAGDGIAAAGLQPPPTDFTDTGRAAQRSPFALYQVLTLGIEGTAMAAWPQLSDAERWSLAFHVGGFAYGDEDRHAGALLWGADSDAGSVARKAVPDLATLANASEVELTSTLGGEQARALIAHLRREPAAVRKLDADADADTGLALARRLVDASHAAHRRGDQDEAKRLALSAYLDGIEPIEPMLAGRDAALLRDIETAMTAWRAQLDTGAADDQLAASATAISVLLDRAQVALDDPRHDVTAAFLGSLAILLREGLEALLIVVGIIAYLGKSGRRDLLPWVHAGWVGALLGGLVTWIAATWLIRISGASREITEGLSALFAAAVLLSVGIWMHRKSVAGRWQDYLKQKMSGALARRSALLLFVLAFVSVYREVFETILFFAAMWNARTSGAIVAGVIVGSIALAAVAWWMLRLSRRLPIAKFFSLSSVLIAILAVVLVGKGIGALQEAGWVAQGLLALPRIDWLGIYPTWQSLLAQTLVAAAAVVAFAANARGARAAAS